jgi:CheY-like chemotaxis protein
MTFFLIDDDEIFQFILFNAIKGINPSINIQHFTDGEKGIDYLKNNLNEVDNLPDIVLLDINMPFMNGWEFLKEFNLLKSSINKEIIIYLLTSSDNPDDIKKAKKIKSLSGYLVKPITKLELRKLIKNFPGEYWYDEAI